MKSGRAVMAVTIVCAVVTLLCVVLLATNLFGLRAGEKLPAAEERVEAAELTVTEPEDALPGYLSSPEYLAALSWYNYRQDYDKDGSLRAGAGSEAAAAFGAEYGMYVVYTQDMAGRLTLLAEQYALTLRRSMTFCYAPEELYTALPAAPFLPADSSGVGYCFDDGSFFFEGVSTLSSSLSCAYRLQGERRGFFTETLLTPEVEGGVAWDFTTAAGTTLRLSMGIELAEIFAELPGAFVCLSIPSPGTLSAAGLEELAGAIDWSVLA